MLSPETGKMLIDIVFVLALLGGVYLSWRARNVIKELAQKKKEGAP
jgi:hypothetical protein